MSVFVLQADADALVKFYKDSAKGKDHADTKAAFSTLMGHASTNWASDRISIFLNTLEKIFEVPGSTAAPPPPPPPPFEDEVVKIDGYCPLTNVANTCYMNSVFQILYSISELRKFFVSIDDATIIDDKFISLNHTGLDILTPDAKKKQAKTIKTLSTLFKHFNNNKGKVVNIETELKVGTENLYTIFVNLFTEKIDKERDKHNDAFQFINYIFEPIINFTEIKTRINLFKIPITETIVCKNGKTTTNDRVPEATISLQIKDTAKTITDLLTIYQDPESINNLTESCGNGTPGNTGELQTKQLKFVPSTTTKYVLIQLVRFNYSTGTAVKISSPIIPDPIITINGIRFQIKGCIRHGGTAAGGHYYSILYKNGIPSISLNDHKVDSISDPSSISESLKTEGYIYLYERIPAAPP
jgi:ubiquitin C-terminal hydrolase